MKLSAIRMLPTTTHGVHESCLRAYNILAFVKAWLKQGVPAVMLLELIEDAESGDGGDFKP